MPVDKSVQNFFASSQVQCFSVFANVQKNRTFFNFAIDLFCHLSYKAFCQAGKAK